MICRVCHEWEATEFDGLCSSCADEADRATANHRKINDLLKERDRLQVLVIELQAEIQRLNARD